MNIEASTCGLVREQAEMLGTAKKRRKTIKRDETCLQPSVNTTASTRPNPISKNRMTGSELKHSHAETGTKNAWEDIALMAS